MNMAQLPMQKRGRGRPPKNPNEDMKGGYSMPDAPRD